MGGTGNFGNKLIAGTLINVTSCALFDIGAEGEESNKMGSVNDSVEFIETISFPFG